MRSQLSERQQGGVYAPRPGLPDILTGVVQALVDQGWALADVAVAMRSVADMSALIDRTQGMPQ